MFMKKISKFLVLVLLVLVSCSKKDDPSFNYDLNTLIGTWRIVQFGKIDVTTYPGNLSFEPTYATFNSNGTYSGRGEFGSGTGTYKAVDNTITTYIDGEEFIKYEVISLTNSVCELNMSDNSGTVFIKCKKQ